MDNGNADRPGWRAADVSGVCQCTGQAKECRVVKPSSAGRIWMHSVCLKAWRLPSLSPGVCSATCVRSGPGGAPHLLALPPEGQLARTPHTFALPAFTLTLLARLPAAHVASGTAALP